MQPISRACRTLSVVCCLLAACAASLLPAKLTAQQRTPLPAVTARAHGVDEGLLPASQTMPSITVTLKRTAAQQADLDAYLSSVQTPGTAEYHRWLTPNQFALRFAPDAQPVSDWLASQGFQVASVSAGGMRLTASGTVAQASNAFGVALHRALTSSGETVLVQGQPSVPAALGSLVAGVSGLDVSPDPVAALEAAVDGNAAAVVSADLVQSSVSADELNEVLQQAAAQGQTLVLTHVPNALLPARALVLSQGAASAADASVVTTPRPAWQVAAGLPSGTLRAAPDAAAQNVDAVVSALGTVALKSGRQGEIAARFYAVASEDGVFTHADPSVPAGTWNAADGLGTINVPKLVKALATGSTAPLNSKIDLSSRNVTHGQPITLTATIQGGSGTPTGTVTFGSAQDGTIASAPLTAGTTAGTAVATYTTNALPGGLHGFFGTYNGDSTYAVSTTNTDTATIQPEAAAISGGTSGNAFVGLTVPVMVLVTSPSGIGTPSGSVTVNPYGTALGQTSFTGTLQQQTPGTAVASVTVPATNAGAFTFQASCTSDVNFSCSQPASFNVTIGKGTPAFTLKQTGTASAATLTATASAPAGAATTVVAPTGSVQFLDNGTAIGNALLASGVATYTGALGGGSAHIVTANYIGDGNYNAATATANATAKVTPTVLLTVITAGSSLSATVAPPSGTTAVPTGTVQFLLGTTSLGTGTVTNGVATFSGTYGSGLLTAVYQGDTNFLTATSNVIDTTKVTPTVTLTKTASSATAGTVGLSAAVTSTSTKTPTGAVTFLDGSKTIGTGTLSGGVATFTGALASAARGLRPLAVVTHTLTASYAGDTNFNAAVSNAVSADAATALISTTTALTSSSGYTGPFGTSFTFNVVVTPASYIASGASPSGTVTISDATGVVGTGTLSSGSASIVISNLSVGPHALIASYGGDSSYAASASSPAVNVTIAAVAATIAATVTPSGSIPYGYDGNLNVTVTASAGTSGPSGTVIATINGSNYTGTLSPTAGSLVSTASIAFPVPPPGTYTISVTCGAGITCTTPATVKLTTTKGFTRTTLTNVVTSPQAGVATTLTATVANTGTGSGRYTYGGTVTFYAGNKVLGTSTVANGTATANVIYISATSQSVYAVYSGDTNWNGSTSDPATVTPLPIQPVIGLSANTLNGIVSQNITLTASVGSGLTGVQLVPSGKVTFYDTYNGIIVNLGSAVLLSNGLNAAYATLSTTGLQAGSHSIVAIYAGDSTFSTITASALVVNMGDFSLAFVPSAPTVAQGSAGTANIIVGSLNGFTGVIALGCTPPGGTLTTCTVTPSAVPAGSSATVTFTTTKATAALMPRGTGLALAFTGAGAVCLLGLKRYRLASVLLLLIAVSMVSGGCTQVSATGDPGGNTGSGGTASSGTPLGTLSFTITGAAVDAPIAARHTSMLQVNVQ